MGVREGQVCCSSFVRHEISCDSHFLAFASVATEIVAPVEALNMLQMFSARMVGPDSSW